MHGRGGEEGKRSRHMLTVPTRVSVAEGSSSSSSSPNSFFKDGRKISVGDCALFKPPQDSPPFIGIVRCLTTGSDKKLKVTVNWLYRPSEIKLGKGILLDAALNEIFYSFHKDEIPAASLLHPCKVAFLPKCVELPSEISSFVCRRVYDITNKCLWWLTDQNYINERQEEVDQLLYKTRVEMHATVQSGGRSPKPMNGPTSASQFKAGSDGVQHSVSSFSSPFKGKKREREDQGSEPVKRERTIKMDDGESGHFKQENFLKSEISKLTEKGGLVDSEGVEKLVRLMLHDRNEKKLDLACRSMLAGVIAATDKLDCLSRFVQLRGVPVFDEWLQEKGKVGDGSVPPDNEKVVEEFLLVLLRALDKLPVDLQALQMCNIGKSVNHLRTHKNVEIHKKARSLVDTWKKRVEAEMDAKSARPRLPEVSHVENRHSGGSNDVAMKSSVTQLSISKSASVKLVQGDCITKSSSASPGSLKSVPSPVSESSKLKDGHPRIAALGVTVDLPLTTPRDEKSSSSSPSHNNSQSCSNDHARNVGISGKEDARSSTAGSTHVNKISGGSSRSRKSVNGFPGSALSGVQRDTVSSRSSSLQKSPASEKSPQPGLASGKAVDGPTAEPNGQRLVVKIPNRARSSAESGSGGSFEDPSNMNSRVSSPMLLEKHDQFEGSLKEKVDVYRATLSSDVNTESWQSNDFKDVLTGSDDGDGSPAAVTDEEACRAGVNPKKIEVSKAASSSSGNEQKSGNLQEASFSSMHALVESCAKYSDRNASMSVGDEIGMKLDLLASVAAGEMSKSESPTNSPRRSTQISEQLCKGNNSIVKLPLVDELARDVSQSNDGADSSSISIQHPAGPSLESKEKSTEVTLAPPGTASPPSTVEKTMGNEAKVDELKEEKATEMDDISDCNQAGSQRTDPQSIDPTTPEKQALCGSTSAVTDHNGEHVEENMESKETNSQLGEPVLKVSPDLPMLEAEEHLRPERSKFSGMEAEEAEECTSTTGDVSSVSVSGVADVDAKVEFDLNEGFKADDRKHGESINLTPPGCLDAFRLIGRVPFDSSMSGGLPASVTVPAASKGPCVPPEDLMKSKREAGWKGSAATSAFRPAEPRKFISVSGPIATKKGRPALDIDLNVPDERVLEDMACQSSVQETCVLSDRTNNSDLARDQSVSIAAVRCSGGLDLDLNQVDEASDMGSYSLRNSLRMDNPLLSVKSSGPPHGEASLCRDFDLNDGPVVDEVIAEPAVFSQHTRSSVPYQPPISGFQMSNTDMGNFSSWFPPVAIPSVVPDRGEQRFPIVTTGGSQRILGPPGVTNPFSPDLYRGSVLSSSPALPYPSTSFPYPVFPLGSSFPLHSAAFSGGSATYLDSSFAGRFCLPGIRSQLGPAGMVASNYPRPFVVSLPDGSNNSSGESSRKWGRQGLDLNAGPGGPDLDGRDVTSPLAPRQLSVVSSQALSEEQARMFNMQGGTFKRKEPEGGWDGYRQSSWK